MELKKQELARKKKEREELELQKKLERERKEEQRKKEKELKLEQERIEKELKKKQEEEKRRRQSKALTSFFVTSKKEQDSTVKKFFTSARKSNSIWGTGLGNGQNLFKAKWNNLREENFDKFVKRDENHSSRAAPQNTLLESIQNQMRKHKKEYIRKLKRARKERELKNIEKLSQVDEGKPKRYVLVKYEDFYYDQYEYSGK